MALKTYVLSFADSIKHVPEHPERTAMKSLSFDVQYQVWPSRVAMLKTIDMQSRRASHHLDWRACKIPMATFSTVIQPLDESGQSAGFEVL